LGGGLFIARKSGKFGVVDNSGAWVVLNTYDCISKSGPYLSAKFGDKMALIDMKGDMVIEEYYEELTWFKGDVFRVGKSDDAGKMRYGMYDASGKKILDVRFDGLTVVRPNLFIAEKAGLGYLVDATGKELSAKYSSLGYLNDNAFSFAQNKKTGILGADGKVLLPAAYETIMTSSDPDFFIVTNSLKQTGIVNAKGQFVLKMQLYEATDLSEGMFSLDVSPKSASATLFALYDARKGGAVGAERYGAVGRFSEGYAYASKKGRTGIIDRSGKWAVQPIYSEFLVYSGDGLGGDGDGVEYEYYDDYKEEGMNTTEGCYLSMQQYVVDGDVYKPSAVYSDGLALVELDGKYGYVDKTGKVRIPLVYSYAEPFGKGLANVISESDGGKTSSLVISSDGKVVVDDGQVISIFDGGRKALIKGDGPYRVLDLASGKMDYIFIREGHSIYHSNEVYHVSTYKDWEVALADDGRELMDEDMDFSEYDFRESVRKAQELETDRSIEALERLLKARPQSYTVNYLLAKAYNEKEDAAAARLYLDRAIEIKPENTEARSMRLGMVYKEKDWSGVVQDASVLIDKSDYFDADTYFKRAYAQSSLGNKDAAFEDYTAIIDNTQSSPASYNNRGVIHMSRSNYTLALGDFNQALRLTSADNIKDLALYNNNKGNALSSLGRRSEACAAWRTAAGYGSSGAEQSLARYCR
jgi:tetratricopeptide (TPR) repeat protein